MGAFCKLIDAILLLFFAFMVVAAPLIDGQICLPTSIFPTFFVDLVHRYGVEYEDYLVTEKPHFLVALVWHQLLFLWPLSIVNVYAIVAGKTWFSTTSMIYGASFVTSMTAIVGELRGSGKASERLVMMYVPFIGFGVVSFLRGLFLHSNKTSGPVTLARKKLA